MKNPKLSAFPLSKGTALALVAGLLPVAAQGAEYIRTSATGDWATLAEWNDDSVAPPAFAASTVLPGVGDNVTLNEDRVTDVTTAVGAVGDIQISDTSGGTFLSTTLNINSGGTLEPTGLLTVGAGSDTGTLNVLAGGTLTATGGISLGADPSHSLNISGGTVTSPPGIGLTLLGGAINLPNGSLTLNHLGTNSVFNVMNSGSTGVLNVTGGDFIVAGAIAANNKIVFRGEINISSGTFSAQGGQAYCAGATINITGDDATINVDRFNNSATRLGTINFEFDPTGVSPITCGSYMKLDGTTINVDGTNYGSGPGIINLLTSPNITGTGTFLAANITAPFPGLDSVISVSGGNLVVTLTVPGTTWDGSDDLTWTNPDPTSWSGETYTNGVSATFGDAGFGTVTISGAIEPAGVVVNNTLGNDYTFTGDSISGPGGLIKSGDGNLTLATANTYTGGTIINDGLVQLNDGDALGTGLIEIVASDTSQLVFDDGLTLDEDITVTAAANNKIPFSVNGTATLNGMVTLNAQARMEHVGTINFNGGVATSSNQTFKDAANFNNLPYLSTKQFILHSSPYSINVAGNTWSRFRVAFGADVTIGANNALPIANGVEIGWSATNATSNKGSLDLNGFDQEVAFIETLVIAQGLVNDQEITGSGGTLTVNQALDHSYTGRITGGISVVKSGVGTMTLNNLSGIASDFTGTFEIIDGLVVSQSGGDFSDFGSVKITSVTPGVLNLDYVGTDTVAALDLGSGPVAEGEYGALGSLLPVIESALITGTGTLTVAVPPAPPLVWDGSTNTDWSNPDSDSWSGDTYDDGDGVSFLDANASPVSIVGTVAPDSILVDSTVDYTISGGAISGATGLTKSGAGTLTLASANTYSGVTSTTAGILTVGDDTALGSVAGNTVVGAGSALRLEGGRSVAEPLSISGNGNVTNTGAIQNAGLNTLTGAVSLVGAVRLETEGVNTGTDTLTLTGGVTGDGRLSLIGDFVFSDLPLVVTDDVRIAGDGDALVTTNKKAVFNVAGNDWVKSVIFFGGNLQLGVADALPLDKDIEFGWAAWENSKSSLDLNGFNQTVKSIKQSANSVGVGGDASITDSVGGGVLTVDTDGPADDSAADAEYQGRITGGLSLVKNGAGILTLNNLSSTTELGPVIPNSYTGDTTVNDGTLVLKTADLADGSTVTISDDGFGVLQLDHGEVDVVAGLILGTFPQAPGIYTAANSFGYITGTGILNVGGVTGSYASWAVTNGVTGGVLGDSDNDGNLNAIEYALDMLIDGYEAAGTFTGNTLSFTKRTEAVVNGDVLYSIEVSDDLGVTDPWTTVTPTTNDASTISYDLPGGAGEIFARLNVVIIP